MDKPRIEKAIREILYAIGEDPDREGLIETPKRVAKTFEDRFAGLERDPVEHTKKIFHEGESELVLVKDIPFTSSCEHHLLPVIGTAHIAYVPKDDRVIGLSKLARILDDISLRPQLQERVTNDVSDVLMDNLNPEGVFVAIEAEHMCMTLRGVKKPGSQTVTKAMRGSFKEDRELRNEVFNMIQFS